LASIVSGQGTRTITLQTQPGFTIGTLNVVASNCRGNGSRATKVIVANQLLRSELENLDLELLVYPNPNDGLFTMILPASQENAKLEIYSMDGRLIESHEVPSNEQEFPIDLRHHAAGLYQLRLVSGSEVKSVKIMVE
jgi:hypothetical protein